MLPYVHATRMRTRVAVNAWPARRASLEWQSLHTRPSCLLYTSHGRSNRYSCMLFGAQRDGRRSHYASTEVATAFQWTFS